MLVNEYGELITEIKKNNLKSFEELYNRYSSALLAFSFSFIHDKIMCEDIVQESFLALWQQRDTIDENTNLKNYLFTIVRNKSISFLRETIKQRLSSIDELTETDYFLHRKLISLDQIETSVIDIDNIQKEIEETYNALPDIYKEVFKLSRYENKSNSEIASMLNISVKAVEKRMTKTLKIFKDKLDHNYIFLFLLNIA